MINVGVVNRPGFEVAGRKTWISGQDNELFGRFWEQCRAEGLLDLLHEIQQRNGQEAGRQTGGAVLGVSRVEQDPKKRSFDYWIAVEVQDGFQEEGGFLLENLDIYRVPASQWAIFSCPGKMPDALVTSEIYAFTEWLPNSVYKHALAPEMEVYPAGDGEITCEFWLPIIER